ncbi:hypothetical protein HGA91_05850 [candidate division WWE3 bacterium]|nr:hypothetical protein [candidate division WWE3 bacterium]
MRKTTHDPSDYILSTPKGIQSDITILDQRISTIFHNRPRIIWEGVFGEINKQQIIGYGKQTYIRPDRTLVESFIVGIAAQNDYIILIVNAVDGKQNIIEKYANDLGKVNIAKNNISIKKLADVNIDKLTDLLKDAQKLTS